MCLQGDNEGRRYRSNTNYPTYFDHVQGVKVFKGNQVHSPKCNHVDSLTETQTRLNIFFDVPSRDTLSVLHQQKISATQVSVFRFICMEGYIERAWCYPSWCRHQDLAALLVAHKTPSEYYLTSLEIIIKSYGWLLVLGCPTCCYCCTLSASNLVT